MFSNSFFTASTLLGPLPAMLHCLPFMTLFTLASTYEKVDIYWSMNNNQQLEIEKMLKNLNY